MVLLLPYSSNQLPWPSEPSDQLYIRSGGVSTNACDNTPSSPLLAYTDSFLPLTSIMRRLQGYISALPTIVARLSSWVKHKAGQTVHSFVNALATLASARSKDKYADSLSQHGARHRFCRISPFHVSVASWAWWAMKEGLKEMMQLCKGRSLG